MKERILYIDTIKGIAIFLMVMGHVISWNFANFNQIAYMDDSVFLFVWRFIYAFHMPLFMFAAGLVFPKDDKFYSLPNTLNMALKRFYSLMIPFFSVGLLLYFVNGKLFDYWFLRCLYEIILINLVVEYIRTKLKKKSLVIDTLIYLGVFILLFVAKTFITGRFHTWLGLTYLYRMYLFFCLGCVTARYQIVKDILNKNWIYTLCIIVFIIMFLALSIEKIIPDEYWSFFLMALSGVLICYIVCRGIRQNNKIITLINSIGRYSLEIYLIHFFFEFRFPLLGELYINEYKMVGVTGVVFLQLIITSILSALVILLCYIVHNVLKKSELLSFLLLGRRYQ